MTVKSAFDVLTTDRVDLRELLAAGTVTSVDIIEVFLGQIERHNASGLKLNAMTTTTLKHLLLAIARERERDLERSQDINRSLHRGIPLTVKVPLIPLVSSKEMSNSSSWDNIMTGPELEMSPTVGSAALKPAMVRKIGPVVDMVCQRIAISLLVPPGTQLNMPSIVKAGAIIIGKANLSVRTSGSLTGCGSIDPDSKEMAGWKGIDITTGWSAVGDQTRSHASWAESSLARRFSATL